MMRSVAADNRSVLVPAPGRLLQVHRLDHLLLPPRTLEIDAVVAVEVTAGYPHLQRRIPWKIARDIPVFGPVSVLVPADLLSGCDVASPPGRNGHARTVPAVSIARHNGDIEPIGRGPAVSCTPVATALPPVGVTLGGGNRLCGTESHQSDRHHEAEHGDNHFPEHRFPSRGLSVAPAPVCSPTSCVEFPATSIWRASPIAVDTINTRYFYSGWNE